MIITSFFIVKNQFIDIPDVMFNQQGQFVEHINVLTEIDATVKQEYLQQ